MLCEKWWVTEVILDSLPNLTCQNILLGLAPVVSSCLYSLSVYSRIYIYIFVNFIFMIIKNHRVIIFDWNAYFAYFLFFPYSNKEHNTHTHTRANSSKTVICIYNIKIRLKWSFYKLYFWFAISWLLLSFSFTSRDARKI